MALDASGSVAAIGEDRIVRVGKISSEEPHLLVGHDGPIDTIAISPDGRWVASSGDDDTMRLWPMPDLSEPPLHALPREDLLSKLRSLTNVRVVQDDEDPVGWTLQLDEFPGWDEVPRWSEAGIHH